MKPLFLCSILALLVLLLGCGTKWINVDVSVNDPNGKPLPFSGVLEDEPIGSPNGLASATIPKPKKGEKIFIGVSSTIPGYKPVNDRYAVEEGQTIPIKLEPLPLRLEITKLVYPARLKHDETCVVEIVVNTDEGIAQAVTIKDTLPKDFEYVAGSANSSSSKLTSPQIVDDSLTWSLESLPPFEKVKISYSLRLNSNPEEGERLTQAVVSATNLAGQPVPDKKSPPIDIHVEARPILSIEKIIDPKEIKRDTTGVKCTIALANSGKGKAIAVILEDNWPQGFVYKKNSLAFDTKQSVNGKIIVEGPIGNAPYIWNINVLPASTKLDFTYITTIDPKTIKQGSQSTTLVLKAISESGEGIKKDCSAPIYVNTEIDVPGPDPAPEHIPNTWKPTRHVHPVAD